MSQIRLSLGIKYWNSIMNYILNEFFFGTSSFSSNLNKQNRPVNKFIYKSDFLDFIKQISVIIEWAQNLSFRVRVLGLTSWWSPILKRSLLILFPGAGFRRLKSFHTNFASIFVAIIARLRRQLRSSNDGVREQTRSRSHGSSRK